MVANILAVDQIEGNIAAARPDEVPMGIPHSPKNASNVENFYTIMWPNAGGTVVDLINSSSYYSDEPFQHVGFLYSCRVAVNTRLHI